MTLGIISALERSLPVDNSSSTSGLSYSIPDVIQTDASINPGNSGGPLFNLRGEVVGINTAIVQGGQGIGFATPIQLAKSILSQLKEKGKVTRGQLGVFIQPLTPDLAENLGVRGKQGALVADVTKDGPAEKAGIRSGDLITSYDGREVREEHELPAMVAATKPGTKVTVKVFREGKELSFPVTIAEMEGEAAARGSESEATKGVGLTVQDITPDIARRFDIGNLKGVLVSAVEDNSPAENAGFRQGDIIRQINGKPVPNVEEFAKLMKKHKGDKTIRFLVERGEIRLILALSQK